jgi:RNA polymerase sporulation-specific sigma factor
MRRIGKGEFRLNISSSGLEELLESYASTIRAICRKFYLVGGTEDDLFQEGMIGLFEACKNFKGDYSSEKFRSFAVVCIRRQIYDAIKHANKKGNLPLNNYVPMVKTNSDNEEYEDGTINLLENSSPEDRIIDQEEFDERIAICQKKLSEYENMVLKLYLSGERQSEIATALSKDVKSIDNTIQRIKNKLKREEN